MKHGRAILDRLPATPCVGAEIGVAAGELSEFLLTARPTDLLLLMVDSWKFREMADPYRVQCQQVGDVNGVRNAEAVEADRLLAYDVSRRHQANAMIMQADSIAAAAQVDDASLDFVFIDADHRYIATLNDCRAWVHKVKPGGWIGGHDYARFRDNGVILAVEQFAEERGLTVETGDDWTWFCRIGGEQ